MLDGTELKLKKNRRLERVLYVFIAVCFVYAVGMIISLFVRMADYSHVQTQHIQRWNKIQECLNKSMCVKMLDNGDFECCECSRVVTDINNVKN